MCRHSTDPHITLQFYNHNVTLIFRYTIIKHDIHYTYDFIIFDRNYPYIMITGSASVYICSLFIVE